MRKCFLKTKDREGGKNSIPSKNNVNRKALQKRPNFGLNIVIYQLKFYTILFSTILFHTWYITWYRPINQMNVCKKWWIFITLYLRRCGPLMDLINNGRCWKESKHWRREKGEGTIEQLQPDSFHFVNHLCAYQQMNNVCLRFCPSYRVQRLEGIS